MGTDAPSDRPLEFRLRVLRELERALSKEADPDEELLAVIRGLVTAAESEAEEQS